MRKGLTLKRILFMVVAVLVVCIFMPTGLSKVQAAIDVRLEGSGAYNMDNPIHDFKSITGDVVTSMTYQQPKLLIFYNADTQSTSAALFDALYAMEDFGNLYILAIECDKSTKEEVEAFKSNYQNDNINIDYCYDTGEDAQNSFFEYIKLADERLVSVSYPVMVYIDANNKIQYMTQGEAETQEIIDYLNQYCNAGILNQRPDITKISNVVSGVSLYWKATANEDGYEIIRLEEVSAGNYELKEWENISSTTTHFLDTTAESGKTYLYTVFEMADKEEDRISSYESKEITYVATPDMTLRVNRAVGVGLGWNKIQGATGYAIYRKPYSGNAAWTRIATITDPNTTKWDDTSVKTNNGTVYRYTIRALAGEKRNILSGCRSTGRTMVRLTSRTLNNATKASATSIKCTWGTTVQANGYEVRFMVGNTVYKTFTVGNYKTGMKTFTGLKAGQTYKIQVRSYKKVDGVGTFYSAWSTPKTVTL